MEGHDVYSTHQSLHTYRVVALGKLAIALMLDIFWRQYLEKQTKNGVY